MKVSAASFSSNAVVVCDATRTATRQAKPSCSSGHTTTMAVGLCSAHGVSVRTSSTAKSGRKALVCVAKSVPAPPSTKLKAGVLHSQELVSLLQHAQDNCYAIPAVNCTSSSTMNAVMECAREVNSPVMIQFSNGGGAAIAGKGISNQGEQASIAGSIAGALHVHAMAKYYGVPVVLHTDHCAKKLLPWFDGVLAADRDHHSQHGQPLFSSHMLDLSQESLHANLEICQEYLKQMKPLGLLLEMEIGVTGGEEDGVDNTSARSENLYSKPEEIYQVYETLNPIAPKGFSVAAAFGNVHGVYSPGNVKLTPSILGNAQKFIKAKKGMEDNKPVFFVFHGGSGSSREEIREAISYGVIKMNIDTDTQWAYWDGVRGYEAKYHAYLQSQIGNPEGPGKPNKKYYDPRAWTRAAEMSLIARLKGAFEDLTCVNVL